MKKNHLFYVFLMYHLETGAIILFMNGQMKPIAFFLLVMALSIGIGTIILQIKK